ncbi:hypothetical protein EVAR_5410_1 [Eumeta japonica]|uniref:Uncharacterized protein n=1 Tax=Eumeta variegata TaxID=151549 RepID=A0A4C1T8I4_EUMVA|nr:hypothetical protein EVAR_5410_1 [Eumeta japonica]
MKIKSTVITSDGISEIAEGLFYKQADLNSQNEGLPSMSTAVADPGGDYGGHDPSGLQFEQERTAMRENSVPFVGNEVINQAEIPRIMRNLNRNG